jgi:hypothetical protein
MTEDKSEAVEIIEAHEELVQHLVRGGRRLRALSLVTIVVAGVLSLLYVYQLAYPYVTGQTVVSVDLRDPANLAVELAVLVLALLWLYVGVRDYAFSSRLSRAVRRATAEEKELEKRISQ